MNNCLNCQNDCQRKLDQENTAIESPCMEGVGPENADIMLIGEYPGMRDDDDGTPFVSRSGKLLQKIFSEVELRREDIYLTNAVKCYTYRKEPKPTDKEIKLCKKYLIAEIKKVNPKVIGAFGGSALLAVLSRKGIKKLKNNVFWSKEFDIKVVPMLSPNWVLRNPSDYIHLYKGLKLVAEESKSRKILQCTKNPPKILTADTVEKIKKVLTKLEASPMFSFDFETTALNFLIAKPICVSVSWDTKTGVTIPWDVLTSDKEVYKRFADLLYSSKLKVNQNIKFDIKIALKQGLRVRGPFYDTMTAHHLLDENAEHNLEYLVLQYLDIGEYWAELDKEKKRICKDRKLKAKDFSYDMLPKPVLFKYAGYDSVVVMRLKEIFDKKLEKEGLTNFYVEHTLPIMVPLLQMEYKGLLIDRPRLKGVIADFEVKIQKETEVFLKDENIVAYEKVRMKAERSVLRSKYKESVVKLESKYEKSKNLQKRFPDGFTDYAEYRYGTFVEYFEKKLKEDKWKFNFASPKQLGGLLFSHMGLEVVKRTKTGPSTDVEVMEFLADKGVDIAMKIVELRHLSKYMSTYLVSTYVNSKIDGRIHTNYLQTATVSGRLASKDPPLQTLPKKAVELKSCIRADPGYQFLKADLGQAEFRVWAHCSQDEDMLNDIRAGLDIHKKMAALCFGIPESEVTEEQRDPTKNLNFGLMYGRGNASVVKQFNITVEQAEKLRELFFQAYPKAAAWIEDRPVVALRDGFVATMWGRKRRLTNIDSDDQGTRAEAERQSKNSPIQAQASDMNNAYMVRTVKNAKKYKIDCYPALTIHDDNTFQVRIGHEKRLMQLMTTIVERSFPEFTCPMILDFAIGPSLGELKKVKIGDL